MAVTSRCCVISILSILIAQQTVNAGQMRVAQQTVNAGRFPTLVGVCYGTLGDNLPPPSEVMNLYINNGIRRMRIYNPNPQILEALQSTGIAVAVGVANEELASIAASQEAANAWVNTNIIPYRGVLFEYVVVGNEVIPGVNAQYAAPAMRNIKNAMNSVGLNSVYVTTAVSTGVLGISYPPSKGTFSDQTINDMKAIISFLCENQKVLMLHVYPYFAYAGDPNHISLAYAQFFNIFPEFYDGDLAYYNLYDAIVDALYSALEKVGGQEITIITGETGWPSAGNGDFTSVDLAQRYNINFMQHIRLNGTPKRPYLRVEGYIFAMFNENQKMVGDEQNFGLFYPNGQPVYPVNC